MSNTKASNQIYDDVRCSFSCLKSRILSLNPDASLIPMLVSTSVETPFKMQHKIMRITIKPPLSVH